MSILESERLILRPPRPADIQAMRERVRTKQQEVQGLVARNLTPDHPTRASAERELATLQAQLYAPSSAVGFVRTGKARAHIRHYMKTVKFEESVTLGRKLLLQALRGTGRTMFNAGVNAAEQVMFSTVPARTVPRLVRTAAIRNLQPGPKRVAEVLGKALKSNDQAIRLHAMETIVEQGREGDPDLPKDSVTAVVIQTAAALAFHDRATSGNDFSFTDLRKHPMSIYVVVNADDIRTLSPLVRLFFGELRLGASYGITSWLSTDVMWSLRLVHVQFQLEDLERRPIEQPYGEEIHHRTETLVGLSDPWLGLRGTHRTGDWTLSVRLGIPLPVGATVDNPFQRGRAGLTHQHIQFGTGTVDPFVGVEVRRLVGRFTISADLLGKFTLYQNRHGYQAGNQFSAGLRTWSDLWTKHLIFMAGASAINETAERWNGIYEGEGNLGRTDLVLDTSISARLPRGVILSLGGRIPLYSIAAGEQLTSPAVAELSVTRSFDLNRRR